MNAMALSICVDDYPHTMALHRGETASASLNLAWCAKGVLTSAKWRLRPF
jgi:hypothetical protein